MKANNKKILMGVGFFIVALFLFQIGLHQYYQSKDVPFQKWLMIAPHDSFGIVYTKDLPCGNGDLICAMGKAHFLTFTAPSGINIGETFSIFISNIGEPWYGGHQNTVKVPGTSTELDCSAAAATFWLEKNGVKYSVQTKNLVYAAGAGNCYSNAYYSVNSDSAIKPGDTFYSKVSVAISSYTKEYSATTTVTAIPCSASNLPKCVTQTDCEGVGGQWCHQTCVDKSIICACPVEWTGSPFCQSNNVWQNRRDLDCSISSYQKEACNYGCTNGACNTAPINVTPVITPVCNASDVVIKDCCGSATVVKTCVNGNWSGDGNCPTTCPTTNVCGNNICDSGETSVSCSQDCIIASANTNTGSEISTNAILLIIGVFALIAFIIMWRI